MKTKETNPKDVLGIERSPVSTVPGNIIYWLGLALLEGARKYGRHNYRVYGARASVYYDAAMGHLIPFWEGEDNDEDSNLPHLIKALASITVLMDSIDCGNWLDDRPPITGRKTPRKRFEAATKDVMKRIPTSVDPYCQKDLERTPQPATGAGTPSLLETGSANTSQRRIEEKFQKVKEALDMIRDLLVSEVSPIVPVSQAESPSETSNKPKEEKYPQEYPSDSEWPYPEWRYSF